MARPPRSQRSATRLGAGLARCVAMLRLLPHIGHDCHVDDADDERRRRSGAEDWAELSRLAGDASPRTAAALTTTRDLLAAAMPDAGPLAMLDDANL
jgi:hypothetical protein